MKNIILIELVAILLLACDAKQAVTEDSADAGITTVSPATTVQSAGLEHGAAVDAAFWHGAAGSYVLVAAGIDGVEILAPDGTRKNLVAGIEAGMLTTVPDVALADGVAPLIIVYDASTASTSAWQLDIAQSTLRQVMRSPIDVRDEVTGLCHHRSRLSGSDYLYVVTDGGLIHQYELFVDGNAVRAQLLRTVPSGKGSGFCAVDPRDGLLYVSEEATGIWRLGAEPESDTTREPVDLRAPFGRLGGDIKGVAIYPVDAATSYLIAADLENERLAIYALPEHKLLAAVSIAGLGEPEGLAATIVPIDASFSGGVIAVANDSVEAGGPNVTLIAWQTIADAAGLSVAAADSRPARPVVVMPVYESDVMPSVGDAADDPAIWFNARDPAMSLVIGTNKQAGLHVYDLRGRTLQKLPDGKMNNVDLRDGFPLAGATVALVAASNRTNDSIAAYRVDAEARRLVDVAAGTLPTGFDDPYGLCLYRSAASGEFYVFVNEGDSGRYRQWRLFANDGGRVGIELVREFDVGSQAEGCVADDDNGKLYIAEEDVGLWKYSAEPDGGDSRTLIDDTADGNLTDDIEGVSLWTGPDGGGYLVVSNQGEDNYALYRRNGDNEYVGKFHVVANAAKSIDGSSETDGIDVSSAALGPDFPAGLLVVQDGRNIGPEEPQNFKFVSWADIARAMQLD